MKPKDKKIKITTSRKQLESLYAAKKEADKLYFDYKKKYNEEHGTSERTTIIKEIIALVKKGYNNAEIIEKGYNKNTVKRQVGLFKKGKKVEKTIVSQYLGKKKDADDEGDEDGGEE